MKNPSSFLAAILLSIGAFTTPAHAGNSDSLFINLTSDDSHRALMAISFGAKQSERGHALTLYLNDRAVLIGSKVNAEKFAEQQKILSDLVAKGATILICPMCMKHFGIKEADLLPGVKVSNPDLAGSALFKDNTKTLSW